MDNEQLLKVLSRLSKDVDGKEFITYLHQLAKDNYEAFKLSKDSSTNDIHKGYAIAIDGLIKAFDTSDQKLIKQATIDLPQQMF